MRIVVTGANSAVGRAIVSRTIERKELDAQIIAVVRSERAAAQVPAIPSGRGGIVQIPYDAEELARAAKGATSLVHLPGILVERRGASYHEAHVATTEAAVRAARAAGVGKVVLASAVGADPASRNRYFRSKGEAEQIVRASGRPFTILRAPLLLGPHTEGARALRREASSRSVWLLSGGQTWHQPMDVTDLAEGLLRAASNPEVAPEQVLEVGGPERLRYRELVLRAAGLRGAQPRIHHMPAFLLRPVAALRTWVLGPGFSPDVLEVLLTDTTVDAAGSARELGISLGPLDVTLQRSLLLPEGP